MDAITLLKNDHQTVEKLFKRFEKSGDRAHVAKREIVDRIIEELSVHAAIEEQLLYPVVRATVPDAEDLALESLEEHHIVKWVLAELETMAPTDERFDAKVTVLIENVRHHVQEEERELFPKIRRELGRRELGELGDALDAAKDAAPTHPHPHGPDAPPANALVGMVAGIADRIGDTLSGLAQGSVTAVGDVIATVLHRGKPRVSPTGSSVARSTADEVRSEVADATEAVISAARPVQREAEDISEATGRTATTAARAATATARSAADGASATADTARRGAKRTARTASRGATSTKRAASRARTSTEPTTPKSAGNGTGSASSKKRTTGKATASRSGRAA